MLRTFLALTLFLAACQSTAMLDQPSLETPFSDAFHPPLEVKTTRMRLAPLEPSVNQLDYDACQASREHLSTTMQWGGWPQGTMTLAENRVDLERHWAEFENHEAYAYTVLAPSGESVIGCVYLYPLEGDPRGLTMAFWVTTDQLANHLDRHLVETVLKEIERAWPVDFVALPIPEQNPHGMKVLADLGLDVVDQNESHRVYGWRR